MTQQYDIYSFAHGTTLSMKQSSDNIVKYRGPQKSKPPLIFQKIVLKIANEIRFLRKVKV